MTCPFGKKLFSKAWGYGTIRFVRRTNSSFFLQRFILRTFYYILQTALADRETAWR
jgi:hypothetical protein